MYLHIDIFQQPQACNQSTTIGSVVSKEILYNFSIESNQINNDESKKIVELVCYLTRFISLKQTNEYTPLDFQSITFVLPPINGLI